MKTVMLTLFVLVFLLTGCQGSSREKDDQHHDHAHDTSAQVEVRTAGAPENLLVIDPEMLRDLRITSAPAEARTGGERVTVLGEVHVNEEAYAEVGSPVTARVSRVLVSLGSTVRPGQVLVELHSVELGRIRAEYLAAKAQLDFARQSLQRKRRLNEERIVPQREVQEAEAETVAAEAALRAARTALSALGIRVDAAGAGSETDPSLFQLYSPIAGTVIERSVVHGQVVDPGKPLFRVADLSRLWLIVHAFERDAVRVTVGSAVQVAFPALPGRSFSGTVSVVGSQVDVESRTIPVRIHLTNEDGLLRPGMSATASFALGDDTARVIAVPTAALQRLQKGWCVFLPRGNGQFEVRLVGRGRDLGGEVEILSGLAPGETVVVEGAFLLKAEAEKSRGEGKHHEH